MRIGIMMEKPPPFIEDAAKSRNSSLERVRRLFQGPRAHGGQGQENGCEPPSPGATRWFIEKTCLRTGAKLLVVPGVLEDSHSAASVYGHKAAPMGL